MIVLDTNVVSELMRAQPEAAVLAWLRSHPAKQFATTAVTVAEMRYGIRRLPEGRRRRELAAAADEVFRAFAAQVLPFAEPEAKVYAELAADLESAGQTVDGFDIQIAAICRAAGASLATRNVAHFRATGVVVVNPWEAAPVSEP